MITELNEANFDAFLVENEKIIIDFHAESWCGGCKLLYSTLKFCPYLIPIRSVK